MGSPSKSATGKGSGSATPSSVATTCAARVFPVPGLPLKSAVIPPPLPLEERRAIVAPDLEPLPPLGTCVLVIDDDVRNGFGAIRVHFDIRADADEDDIKALVAQSQKRSAVFDIVTNPTAVFVTVN